MKPSTLKIKQTFDIFDRDGSGSIDLQELDKVLSTLGQNITELELQNLVAQLDKDGDGQIDFDEFASLDIISDSSENQNEDLREVFKKFDRNGDGFIDVAEMSSQAMSILNKSLSDAEIIEMFRIADNDGNGQLDYDEFVKVIMAKSAELASSDAANGLDELAEWEFAKQIPESSWEFVKQLQEQAIAHQAFNHPYLQRLAEGKLPDMLGALQDFAVQYSQYSKNFKTYLNITLDRLTDSEHEQLILDNYQEEEGHLDEKQRKELADLGIDAEWIEKVPHTRLFEQFKQAIEVNQDAVVCPQAIEFDNKMRAICSQHVAAAIGAIGLAGELGVSRIYSYILRAIKRFTPLAPREYVFFTLHTQMDGEHTKALLAIAADFAGTEEGREQLTQGMNKALSARSVFWDAMLERALAMPEKKSDFVSPEQLYESNSQKWVRNEPSCLSDFTARPVIFDLCEPVKDAVILDLGCGEGYCSRELMRRGAKQVVGVDISTSSIAAAEAEEQREPLGITYLAGNSTQVETLLRNHNLTQSEGFDVIVAVFLFNYLTLHEMVQCMSQVKHLLKPGGRFIFSIPHPTFAFLSKSEGSFHFDVGANGNGQKATGYFSARDRLLPGKIARRDGTTLPVQVRHKTIQDYFDALQKSGFTTLPKIQELKVTDEHLQLDPAFFGSLADVPLHMAFSVEKPLFEQPKVPASKKQKAVIKDIVWTQVFDETDYCFQIPNEVLAEFDRTRKQLEAKDITWRNYEPGDAGELPNIRSFAHKMRDRCYETTGFVLIQGLPLADFGSTYEEREEVAKLLYYIISINIGLVSDRRGRLYDVRDRGLNVADDNVLFSATKEASGWHSDSTDKDFNPDIVGLLCLQDGDGEGGVLQNVNALNVYYRLKQILPQSIFDELEKPVLRDLIEKGLGADSGDTWEQLRRSSDIGAQAYRLRKNTFPIFGRDRYTNQFSCRYMRYWIDSGHKKSKSAMSPLLKIAMNALEDVLDNDETIYRIERKLHPGEIIYTNNHICLHNRTAYEERAGQPRRHMVRTWIDFNPQWSKERQ